MIFLSNIFIIDPIENEFPGHNIKHLEGYFDGL